MLYGLLSPHTWYRTFELLTPHLESPKTLYSQLLYTLPHSLKAHLISSYYSFDERVVRELMGKKLSSRARKELDDVVERTKVPLAGCRRMFDNLKRVAKKIEDSEGDMIRVIQSEFLLSREVASQYANIIFISNYRLDTTKRKLSHLQFSDFTYVASIFIQHFTHPTTPPLEDLDPQLSQDSRDLKTVLLNQKEVLEDLKTSLHRHLSSQQQKPHILSSPQNATNALKVVMRNVFSLGGVLTNGREFRDVFLILQERVVEPCVAMGWSSSDTEAFLASVPAVFGELGSISVQIRQRYAGSVGRLFTAVKFAAGRFHQAVEQQGEGVRPVATL
ncbi:hypothetical protein HDV00_007253 [Rhizophlyctis rosea]|nr:hypothetical protein HDV00_007253 [Rhizophlyctis rosea]